MEFDGIKSVHTRKSLENIRAEQAIRKRKRQQIKRDIQHGFTTVLPADVSAHVASFVCIKMPISQESIDEIQKIFSTKPVV